jgi:hypothetical protein
VGILCDVVANEPHKCFHSSILRELIGRHEVPHAESCRVGSDLAYMRQMKADNRWCPHHPWGAASARCCDEGSQAICAFMLASYRSHSGSLTRAAFLPARMTPWRTPSALLQGW